MTGSRTLYYPYGEERWSASGGTLTTDYGFTGQRRERGIGLYDYNARFYDPALGRFVSADTIVPDHTNPQSLNRFSYVVGNPLKFKDPTGHYYCGDQYDPACFENTDEKVAFDNMTIQTFNLPSYSPEELDMAARIVSKEVGVEEWVRADDYTLRQVARAVAWTMRNRIEIGEELEGTYETYYGNKKSSYTEAFYGYTPYALEEIPDTPDPIVLSVVEGVFLNTNRNDPRTGDPTDGVIFVINRDLYLQKLATLTEDPVHRVEWTPDKPDADKLGVYFFKHQP
ncbi:MAG: RHS repeat-associated core domain-containing protein [Aestuariibacter sp.]|nr:RHS repeat-associated core domain-containing protein [Aestuariibacter sp.]